MILKDLKKSDIGKKFKIITFCMSSRMGYGSCDSIFRIAAECGFFNSVTAQNTIEFKVVDIVSNKYVRCEALNTPKYPKDMFKLNLGCVIVFTDVVTIIKSTKKDDLIWDYKQKIWKVNKCKMY